jgi:hypothetical protein
VSHLYAAGVRSLPKMSPDVVWMAVSPFRVEVCAVDRLPGVLSGGALGQCDSGVREAVVGAADSATAHRVNRHIRSIGGVSSFVWRCARLTGLRVLSGGVLGQCDSGVREAVVGAGLVGEAVTLLRLAGGCADGGIPRPEEVRLRRPFWFSELRVDVLISCVVLLRRCMV